ncbi:hypothetical protein V8J36_05445 [Frigidibacter sp. MR17.14]|uniref:hypothetical protein n=1 Tax=Frigidibacter sp. MR17.14 TaxID=3126509 RepID=UPI003012AF84
MLDERKTSADTARADAEAALLEHGSIFLLQAASALADAAIKLLERAGSGTASIGLGQRCLTLRIDLDANSAEGTIPAPSGCTKHPPLEAEPLASVAVSIPISAPAPTYVTGPFSDAELATIDAMFDTATTAEIAQALNRQMAPIRFVINRRMAAKARLQGEAEAQQRDTAAEAAEAELAVETLPASEREPEAPADVPEPTPPAPVEPSQPAPARDPVAFLKSAMAEVQTEVTEPTPLQAHLAKRSMKGWSAAMDLQLMEMSFEGIGQDVIILELGKSKAEIRERFDSLTCMRKFKMAEVVSELQRASRKP